MKINSDIIKTAVMSYFRFTRGFPCVDEVWGGIGNEICDVLVQSDKGFYDIEIKISKSDLWHGEAKKNKHIWYKNLLKKKRGPNYFYICVPDYLLEEAEKWVTETNTKYGILVFNVSNWKQMYPLGNIRKIQEFIYMSKRPQRLQTDIDQKLYGVFLQRICSAYINIKQKILAGNLTNA